jgi:hypothetical protein
MPQILVTAATVEPPHGRVMWRERITLADLESDHFIVCLLERLRWAVLDCHAEEHAARSDPATSDAASIPESTPGPRR